jgi:hypothetical protein
MLFHKNLPAYVQRGFHCHILKFKDYISIAPALLCFRHVGIIEYRELESTKTK